MSAFRLVVLSLLVSALALAVSASQIPFSGARATITILPDLTPPKVPAPPEIVLARLKERLTAEMRVHFDLFLYVSKSDHGPLAQRMYVFRKQPNGLKVGGLKLAYEWAASTGREKVEVNARGRHVITATPMGYYQLDPKRMYPHYHSASWDQDMTSVLFFDWERAGSQTGIAIHAAAPADIAMLGSRASGGCVHLAPDDAATLYELIQASYGGPVPRFAYNHETRTGSNHGDFMRNRQGELKMAEGYRVLVMIEDYSGEDVTSEDGAALF
jgi:hypothetical protein